jgi:uncharacterized protein
MEKLLNEFVVNRPIDQAWAVLTDVERIAPCMPGAELHEIEGEVFRGAVKVKLGSISAAFKGQASFVERDDQQHRAVLKADGRDTGGKGNASATITAAAEEVDSASTKVVVATDLQISGRVAQFGRGIVAEVSKKLVTQFADNLDQMLEGGGQRAATATVLPADVEPATTAADATAGDGSAEAQPLSVVPPIAGAPTTGGEASRPAVRKIEGPAAEPVELSGVAGPAILKRVLPALVGLVLVALIVRRLRK